MLEFDNIRLELESYEVPVAELKDALHIDRVSDQISEYENRMQEPDFWNNVEKATEIQQTLGRLKKKVESYNALVAEREDLLALCELANEEEDLDSLEELKASTSKFKEDFEKMRLETLLTGPYDANNATITLHAGAGGTEAMDWCSMLYRMYTRWAESHGFAVEELDFVEGDTAGIQSVSLMIKGEYAYGFLRSELGVHRLAAVGQRQHRLPRHEGAGRERLLERRQGLQPLPPQRLGRAGLYAGQPTPRGRPRLLGRFEQADRPRRGTGAASDCRP